MIGDPLEVRAPFREATLQKKKGESLSEANAVQSTTDHARKRRQLDCGFLHDFS